LSSADAVSLVDGQTRRARGEWRDLSAGAERGIDFRGNGLDVGRPVR